MPGNLGNAFFQAIVEQTGISTFGPYLVSAAMQFALIMMIAFFFFRGRRRPKPLNPDDTEADWSSEDDETETLLNQTDISRIADGFANDFVLGGSSKQSSRRSSRSSSRSSSRHGSEKYQFLE